MNRQLEHDRLRFEVELEFVQCLSNPVYLHWLSQQPFYENEAFINYLGYLQYWKKPEYAVWITYPHALFFLSMLQEKRFRDNLRRPDFFEHVYSQQGLHWKSAQKANVEKRTMLRKSLEEYHR